LKTFEFFDDPLPPTHNARRTGHRRQRGSAAAAPCVDTSFAGTGKNNAVIQTAIDNLYPVLPTLFTVLVSVLVASLVIHYFARRLEGMPPLVHLTSVERAQQIDIDGFIVGPVGVYAVPFAVGLLPLKTRARVTGLPEERVRAMVRLHPDCLAHFRRVIPIGPYTWLKFVLSNYYCPYYRVYHGRFAAVRVMKPIRLRTWLWLYSWDWLVWIGIVAFVLQV
jgi:hypothetical protein